jgi:aminoglycoside 3-N-acetyltransferase
LYERDALILMIGVDYHACSALHLAEYRYCARPPRRLYSCVVRRYGRARWFDYWDVALDDGDFGVIGSCLEYLLNVQGSILSGRVGHAESRLLPMRRVVDFASEWMADNRPWGPFASRGNRPW